MSATLNPILSVRGLSAYYKTLQAVKEVSFDLYKGKTLAIVGESGSGKSTLAYALAEAHSGKVSGEILYNSKPVSDLRAYRGSKITMIFQDPSSALNPVYTIGEHFLEAINLHFDLTEEEAFVKALESLAEAQIDDPEGVFYKYPHELSGGQKQRAMIGMATIVRPDILIADEPTTALDATIQREIIHLLQRLQKELGMAVLLISHDMGIVSELADEVAVMYAGQLVERGSTGEVLTNPKHPYTQALVKASFLEVGEDGRLSALKGRVPVLSDLPHGCRFHPRCPYAWDKCTSGEVPLLTSENQQVRCWLYE